MAGPSVTDVAGRIRATVDAQARVAQASRDEAARIARERAERAPQAPQDGPAR